MRVKNAIWTTFGVALTTLYEDLLNDEWRGLSFVGDDADKIIEGIPVFVYYDFVVLATPSLVHISRIIYTFIVISILCIAITVAIIFEFEVQLIVVVEVVVVP